MSLLRDLAQPILNAPMAGAAGGRLAGAVSAAGGFGMIGIAGAITEEWLAREVPLAAASGRPWGAGMMAWVLDGGLDPVRMVLDHKPDLLCISFGDPGPAAQLARDAGVTTAMQVGNAEDVDRAIEADIDLIVCRGSEGGGHGRGEVATLPLLQLVLDRTDKPVIAAGGIATARGVAAVLAAGAAAAWVGTRFAACTESLSADSLKQAIASAAVDDTVYTRAFDVAQRIPWPSEFGGRAIRNPFTEEWADRIDELQQRVDSEDELTDRMNAARASGDVTVAPVYAGQSAGLTPRVESAADVIADLARFREHLNAAWVAWQ
ncbi:nitronate monooxygenase family protein [Cryobacterium sp. BB736]|uniref:NAD(P)H-dependent flavin oxidoreductase n=1 Tax=Cryobacterium sp. BB736 TaxID=2746963 RepID=UPI0018741490|nr:nitronate monooxygenase [Cryobacterium sp. BB736]